MSPAFYAMYEALAAVWIELDSRSDAETDAEGRNRGNWAMVLLGEVEAALNLAELERGVEFRNGRL